MENRRILIRISIRLLLLALFVAPVIALGGTLDEFEEEATRDQRTNPPAWRTDSEEDEHDSDCTGPTLDCLAARVLLDVTGHIYEGLIAGGIAYSDMRLAEQTTSGRRNPHYRQVGEVMLPLLRLDLHYQTTR